MSAVRNKSAKTIGWGVAVAACSCLMAMQITKLPTLTPFSCPPWTKCHILCQLHELSLFLYKHIKSFNHSIHLTHKQIKWKLHSSLYAYVHLHLHVTFQLAWNLFIIRGNISKSRHCRSTSAALRQIKCFSRRKIIWNIILWNESFIK